MDDDGPDWWQAEGLLEQRYAGDGLQEEETEDAAPIASDETPF